MILGLILLAVIVGAILCPGGATAYDEAKWREIDRLNAWWAVGR